MSTHRHLIIYKDSKHPLTLNPQVGRGNARGMFLHVVFAALLGLLVACHSHPSFRALDAQRHEADSLVEGLKTNESLDSLIRVAAKQGNHMLEMRARQQLGRNYRESNLFMKAIDCHRHELALAQQLHDTIAMVQALNNIGTNFRRMGVLDEAIITITAPSTSARTSL